MIRLVPAAEPLQLSSPPAESVVEKLTAAILDLVELYCSTFNANFHTAAQSRSGTAPVQEAGLVTNVLSFNVYAAHRVPITWATRYVGSLDCIRFPVARPVLQLLDRFC